jgi:hypothetical protein
MASQRTRNELGRIIANAVHMWKLGQRVDRDSGILPDEHITVELTETGITVTAFEPPKPRRQAKQRDE